MNTDEWMTTLYGRPANWITGWVAGSAVDEAVVVSGGLTV